MATSSFLKENYFLLVTVGSTVLVVTIYHCIIISWRNRPQRANPLEEPDTTHKLADIQKNIPIHTYKTGKGSEDVECAVCLSEFEEGEELRTLPQCMHSFHVACIDMWLCTHLSCPICRTNAVRLVPRGSATLPGQGGGASVMVTGTGSSSGLGSHGDGTRLESSVTQNLEVEHLPV